MEAAKKLLLTSNQLTHYDESLPPQLATDASPCWVGAVISHVRTWWRGAPNCICLKVADQSEQNYLQIDKEALGLVYGVKKFHTYWYGRKSTIVTDHKPLNSTILGPKIRVSTVAAARLQRRSLLLSAYYYELEFRSTSEHGNVDALSRLPLSEGQSKHSL